MKKIYFHKCRIRMPHPGYDNCPCNGIVIDWFHIKLFIKRLTTKKHVHWFYNTASKGSAEDYKCGCGEKLIK